jgi:hypothetical protein
MHQWTMSESAKKDGWDGNDCAIAQKSKTEHEKRALATPQSAPTVRVKRKTWDGKEGGGARRVAQRAALWRVTP